MPADENTRLRIRQRFIELMDEEAADAIMESMPPIPWTEIATKTDIARLDARFDAVDGRLDALDGRLDTMDRRFDAMDGRLDTLDGRLDTMDGRLDAMDGSLHAQGGRQDSLGVRMDGLGERMDALGVHMADLGRSVTIGAVTMALMLGIFVAGTIVSLIATGAYG